MKKYKKALLHVGPDKTGSTAIQSAFDSCRELLHEHGVYYPPGQWHAELGSYFCEKPEKYIFNQQFPFNDLKQLMQRDVDYLAALRMALDRDTANILVLSYEGFVNLDVRALTGLRQFIEEYTESCEVVYYARSPFSYATSAMSQQVRLGFHVLPDGHPPMQPAKVFLERLCTVFGKDHVNVRKFSRDSLLGSDVVFDFLSLLELPDAVRKEVAGQSVEENPALSAEGLLIGEKIIRLLGGHIPPGPFFPQRFSRVLGRIKGTKIQLDQQHVEALEKATKVHCDYLEQEFGVSFSAGEVISSNAEPLISAVTADSLAELLVDFVMPEVAIPVPVETSDTLIVSRPRGKVAYTGPLLSMAPDEEKLLDVVVSNNGMQYWKSDASKPVVLSYHWRDATSEMVVYNGKRTALPKEGLGPGESINLSMRVMAPSNPGNYCLELTIVQESVNWFEELGFRPTVIGVTVPNKYGAICIRFCQNINRIFHFGKSTVRSISSLLNFLKKS
ncbi:MAG: hypothetical protein M8364_07595 [Methylobacter sp.]|uniref:hypothetical protein n=1 Tax=Methylobacter sp. TaxID=2051955 RepID=UPI002586C350|nr:hypothetical protein [Methylobacter sp.]MCL7420749.1 hypothetical protein [Methylobacter sp.]